MRESYGSRIYKQPAKKKIPIIPLLIIAGILGGGYFFFKSLDKPVVNLDDPQQSAPVETIAPSPQEPQAAPVAAPKAAAPETTKKSEKKPVDKQTVATSIALNPPGRMPDLSSKREEAETLFKKGKFRQALDLYQTISQEDVTAYSEVGQCYYFLSDYANARQYLEDALMNDSEDFETRKFMAFTTYQLNDLKVSLDHTKQALKIKEKDKELKSLLDKLNREISVIEDGYKDVRIPKFKLQFSREDHQDTRDLVLDILKKAYREIGQELNYYPDKDITVILYNEKTFCDVTRSPSWAGGLYDGKIRLPIKGVEGHEDEVEQILFHEYTHALVNALASRCPLWLNEGLAEYFSEREVEKIGQVLPLEMLEQRFPSDEFVVSVAYLESYSVVSDMVDKFGLYRIKELLEAQKKHQDIRKAFDEVLYTNYDRFIKEWGRD